MTAPVVRHRVQQLRRSPTLAINELISALGDEDICHLGFGESPFPVHPLIREAIADAAGKNQYLPCAGLEELRHAAVEYFSQKLDLPPANYAAVVGPGSKELLFDLQLAVEGDLLLPVPSWVSYAPQAHLLQDNVIPIPTDIGTRYHVTEGSLEQAISGGAAQGAKPTKLILNYPNNPSGLTIPEATLEAIAETCRKHDVLVISDEIYGLVTHHSTHRSIAYYYPEGTIVTTGLSKHISLGGYRLGIALIPDSLASIRDAVVRIASETWSTVSAPIQFAALTAVANDPEIEDFVERCTRVHSLVSRYVRDRIVDAGVDYPELDGAFYLYPDFEPFREAVAATRGVATSDQLADDVLATAKVATLPGSVFGDDAKLLRLRLATCDFDGQTALDQLANAPESSPSAFVRACCPRIERAGESLADYLSSLSR